MGLGPKLAATPVSPAMLKVVHVRQPRRSGRECRIIMWTETRPFLLERREVPCVAGVGDRGVRGSLDDIG